MGDDKKPKLMVVGYVDHGISSKLARMLTDTHDVEIINPEKVVDLGGDRADLSSTELAQLMEAKLDITEKPTPIIEEPPLVYERQNFLTPKTGREKRKDKRKKKRKKKRRY